MVKPSLGPRAQRKGKSPEQSSNGQEWSDPARDPAPTARAGRRSDTRTAKLRQILAPAQGQVTEAVRKERAPQEIRGHCENRRGMEGEAAGNRNRNRRTHAQPATPRKPRTRAADPGGSASNALQAWHHASVRMPVARETPRPADQSGMIGHSHASHHHSRSRRHQVTAGLWAGPISSFGHNSAGGLTRAVTRRGTDFKLRPVSRSSGY